MNALFSLSLLTLVIWSGGLDAIAELD